MADWEEQFIENLNNVWDMLSSNFYESENLTLYGSSAIAYLLIYYNNNNSNKIPLDQLNEPNDFDFLYVPSNKMEYHTSKYNNYKRKQETPQRSVTYIHNSNKKLSFDLTSQRKVNFIKIGKFNILNPNDLLDIYCDMNHSKIVLNKISLLNNYIKKTKKRIIDDNIEKENEENNINKKIKKDIFS